ncbi:MAG: single-stranded DNA-binding protein [Clostridiales bacterium]|jgi:single-stranded DNA-binding protein|nr:single-stranded DNA-binding protein [Clostridiales bacterium]
MEATNQVFLTGTIVTDPVYSHTVYGEGFYEMFLEVRRLSDTSDRLPITVSERLIAGWNVKNGSAVALNGQLRSYNKFADGASRLRLTVFVREFEALQESRNPNSIELEGYICKPPIYRMTPFKREICDLLLAVNRAYNKSDYIPCIAWGRNARYVKDIPIGVKIQILGRVQSRLYQKRLSETEIETRTAFEVSINQISADGNLPMSRDFQGFAPQTGNYGSAPTGSFNAGGLEDGTPRHFTPQSENYSDGSGESTPRHFTLQSENYSDGSDESAPRNFTPQSENYENADGSNDGRPSAAFFPNDDKGEDGGGE